MSHAIIPETHHTESTDRSLVHDDLNWSPEADEPSREAIAKEAYLLYAARGYQDGWDVEDWLAAEESLRHRRES